MGQKFRLSKSTGTPRITCLSLTCVRTWHPWSWINAVWASISSPRQALHHDISNDFRHSTPTSFVDKQSMWISQKSSSKALIAKICMEGTDTHASIFTQRTYPWSLTCSNNTARDYLRFFSAKLVSTFAECFPNLHEIQVSCINWPTTE